LFNNVFGYISKVFFKMLKLFKNINLKLKKSREWRFPQLEHKPLNHFVSNYHRKTRKKKKKRKERKKTRNEEMITCIILGSSWPSSPSNGGVQVCTKEGLIKKSKKNIDRWAVITNGCTVSASDSLRVYIHGESKSMQGNHGELYSI
jgi:hypothetical protein